MVAEISAMKSDVSQSSNALIIIFTRFPEAEKTKTRLIPVLGPEGAADLQKQMTEFTVRQAELTGQPLQICYVGGTGEEMRDWLGAQHDYVLQSQGDLGARMSKAFEDAFNAGSKKVILIGSDCPDNRTANMLKAIQLLDKTSCVLGPAFDGGYYLIGLTKLRLDLFTNIEWGTASVLQQTLRRTIDYKLLPGLNDVDEICDIPPLISVIIPALNEEKNISSTIERISSGFSTEVIVVDGGSTDRTADVASLAGARVIFSEKGRAIQMNYGATHAEGDILLFLHADSLLPDLWDYRIRKVIRKPRFILGYFYFAICETFPGKRWLEWGTNLRSVLLKRPYGDQGFFLLKTSFFMMKGFPDVPILEDLFFVKLAKRHGRLYSTNTVLLTSARRWQKLGYLRTLVINQVILLLSFFKANLKILQVYYDKGKIVPNRK